MSNFLLPSCLAITVAVVWFLLQSSTNIPILDRNAPYESLCKSGHILWFQFHQYDAAIEHFRVAFSKLNETTGRKPCQGLDEVFSQGSELTAFFIQRVKQAEVQHGKRNVIVNFLLTHRLENGKPITERIFEASSVLMTAAKVDLPLEPCLLLAGWVHSISLPIFVETLKKSGRVADTISALHSILDTCLLGHTWQAPVSAKSDVIGSVSLLYTFVTRTYIHCMYTSRAGFSCGPTMFIWSHLK